MNLPIKIYKLQEDGYLHFVDEGTCAVYSPKPNDMEPYVTLNFGTMRLHIAAKDFEVLCRNFLYNRIEGKDATALLRSNF